MGGGGEGGLKSPTTADPMEPSKNFYHGCFEEKRLEVEDGDFSLPWTFILDLILFIYVFPETASVHVTEYIT